MSMITETPAQTEPPAWTSHRQDWLCAIGLSLLTLAWAYVALRQSALPMEDAAMLMRYAVHLAAGQGITWNAGSPPVDGATDFLFMVVLAGVVKMGVPVEAAVRGIDIFAHLATVLVVYVTLRGRVRVGPLPAALSAAYLALGPGVIYASMGFGTPFFAFFVALTWAQAIGLAQNYERRTSLAFALSGLLMGLTRPDGVPLLVFMLAAVLYYRRGEKAVPIIRDFVIAFGLPAILYFAWHWHYFGYPLPNPYYIKGKHLHPDSLNASVRNTLTLCFPFFLAWVAGLRARGSMRWTVFVLIPIAGFAAQWVLLSNEMNHAWRFQYAVLPLALMSWPLPLRGGAGEQAPWPSWQALSRRERTVWSAAATLFLLALAVAQTGRNWALVNNGFEGKYAMARAIAPFAPKGYTVSVTEAGLLPLYSGWRAIDTWGLNDAWIAHHGAVTPAYLDSVKPEVLMFHTGLGPPPPGLLPSSTGFGMMIHTLQDYVRTRHYRLAGAFSAEPASSEWYYVLPSCPDADALVRAIQKAGRANYEQTVALPTAP